MRSSVVLGTLLLSALVLGALLLGCSGPAVSTPPTQPKGAPAPAIAPEPRRASVNVRREAPPVARNSVAYEFADPHRKERLVQGLSDLQAWAEQRGKELKVAGLFVGVVVDGCPADADPTSCYE